MEGNCFDLNINIVEADKDKTHKTNNAEKKNSSGNFVWRNEIWVEFGKFELCKSESSPSNL